MPASPPSTDTARILLYAAFDAEATFDASRALDMLRRARAADPHDVVVNWAYIRYAVEQGQRPRVVREYERLARAGETVMECLAAVAGRPGSGGTAEAPRAYAMVRAHGLRPCTALYLAEMLPMGRDVPGVPRSLDVRRLATEIAPELASTWLGLSTDLLARGDSSAADSVLDAALHGVRHPMERVQVLAARAARAAARGRPELAAARWDALIAAAERDGRPGVVYAVRSQIAQQSGQNARRESDFVEREALIRGAGPGTRAGHAMGHAAFFVARGEFARAIPYYDRALAIADSLPDGGMKADYRLNKGRALAKMGLMADAVRTLREALAISAGTNMLYTRAEIWHNLSHAYEGEGAFAEALAASDSFVRLAGALDHDPIRIISRRDAGLLRLNAGWHASAYRQFDAMVGLIDAERQNHYWAGEYYERIGDYRAALTYFRKGLALDAGERSLNLAGLTRAYEALGFPDSAAASARDHDAFMSSDAEVPLAPDVLSRAGRHEDAIRAAQRWARRREMGGNVQGATRARLQTARVLLAAGRARAAAAEARRALRLATSVNLSEERMDALRLAGTASAQAGGSRSALASLREAARLSLVQGDVRLVRETHQALGDAWLRLRDVGAALAAYDRAARVVEQATSRMDQDVDRARYRGLHMAPFDAAVAALVHSPERIAELADWSARRKAAALALATGAASDRRDPIRLASVQRTLASNEAVVDYLALPAGTWALVIRRDTAMVIELAEADITELSMLARRVTRGFVSHGARVDLARIAFDMSAASRLYQILVQPLRPALEGAERLTIVPDGPVHHVPFAVLVDGSRYLLDEMEVRYAPSLAFAATHAEESLRGVPLLLVRTDVPGGREESRTIHAAWAGSPVTELAHGRATEEALESAAPRARIIHFATHAETSDRDPLATHLELAPGHASDGLLHLSEIGGRQYRNRLVVLAACESANGELLTGEGFMGLSRAFLAAGASGVVATRWPVDANAAAFSAAFYAALARGSTTSAAATIAQRALRARPETAHPFYWGGYLTVVGGRSEAYK